MSSILIEGSKILLRCVAVMRSGIESNKMVGHCIGSNPIRFNNVFLNAFVM
jgi:hypothetical protein